VRSGTKLPRRLGPPPKLSAFIVCESEEARRTLVVMASQSPLPPLPNPSTNAEARAAAAADDGGGVADDARDATGLLENDHLCCRACWVFDQDRRINTLKLSEYKARFLYVCMYV
jgi:hypothetical protein